MKSILTRMGFLEASDNLHSENIKQSDCESNRVDWEAAGEIFTNVVFPFPLHRSVLRDPHEFIVTKSLRHTHHTIRTLSIISPFYCLFRHHLYVTAYRIL